MTINAVKIIRASNHEDLENQVNLAITNLGLQPSGSIITNCHDNAQLYMLMTDTGSGGGGSLLVHTGDDLGVYSNGLGQLLTDATANINGSNLLVELGVGATIVQDGVDITVPVTGTFVTKITPTVVNGAITGFHLS